MDDYNGIDTKAFSLLLQNEERDTEHYTDHDINYVFPGTAWDM
jgi:hypothetical protein